MAGTLAYTEYEFDSAKSLALSPLYTLLDSVNSFCLILLWMLQSWSLEFAS
jgi:hypothetical protein